MTLALLLHVGASDLEEAVDGAHVIGPSHFHVPTPFSINVEDETVHFLFLQLGQIHRAAAEKRKERETEGGGEREMEGRKTE